MHGVGAFTFWEYEKIKALFVLRGKGEWVQLCRLLSYKERLLGLWWSSWLSDFDWFSSATHSLSICVSLSESYVQFFLSSYWRVKGVNKPEMSQHKGFFKGCQDQFIFQSVFGSLCAFSAHSQFFPIIPWSEYWHYSVITDMRSNARYSTSHASCCFLLVWNIKHCFLKIQSCLRVEDSTWERLFVIWVLPLFSVRVIQLLLYILRALQDLIDMYVQYIGSGCQGEHRT